WLHNGMVNVGGQKMSKSLGNFTTIRALLDSGISAMTLRLFTLQAHYRKPLDFTGEALQAAAVGWKGLNAALTLASSLDPAAPPVEAITPAQAARDATALPAELAVVRDRFVAAMDDDLNTSAAVAVLFELGRPLRALANRLERGDEAAAEEAHQATSLAQASLLVELAAVLGLKPESSGRGGPGGREGPTQAQIEERIAQRRAAKAARDFATADRIRDQLRADGIELIDRPGGVTDWIRG
ncbi:MAG: DALR domain-containing protein, partial [Cyanobium sp.]